jgi:hypothetical protein
VNVVVCTEIDEGVLEHYGESAGAGRYMKIAVNGQLVVPAGGRWKSPPLAVVQGLVRWSPPRCRASRIR